MAQRNLKQLESACDAAEKHQLQKKLGLQLKMAVKVRDQLRRLEKLRHAIMNLDQKTIAEIKSYAKPPEGVHKVMIATFLLLGNSEKELKVFVYLASQLYTVCCFSFALHFDIKF